MYGGGKYSEADIVRGRKVLSNGAVGGYVRNEQGKVVWRIVSGASAQYLAGVRGNARRPITKRAAQLAFNRHYRNRNGSPRGNKAARTYDLNHTGRRVVADSRYRRSPHKYDFRGVDTGSAKRKARSAKQRQNDARLRALGRAAFQKRGGYDW